MLAALLPALGLTLYRAFEDRRTATSHAQNDALVAAESASRTQALLIDEARQLLFGLAQLPEIHNRDRRSCSLLLARLVRQFGVYANLGLAAANGDVVCSGVPLPGPVDVSDRAYFQRAVAHRSFAVGDYQIGRVSGRPALNVAFPVRDRGWVQGVVFAALDLDWLNQLLSQSQLPAGSVVTVFDGEGRVLARHPDSENWVGRKLPESELVRRVGPKHSNTISADGIDGVSRFYGVVRLPTGGNSGDVFVAVGIPTEVALAGATRKLTRDLLVLGLVGVVALALALGVAHMFLVRPIEALAGAARRIGTGELRTRIVVKNAPRELLDLGRTLDEMASSLNRREQELLKLNDDLERGVAERTAELEGANEELAQQASVNKTVLDATLDGIRLVDLEGRTLVANTAIEKLTAEVFGLPVDSTLSERSAIMARLADPSAYATTMESIAADPQRETLDEFELADVGRSFLRYTGPVPDAEGGLIGRIIVVREVTAEREAERLKSELVATVSHELRTPLASILGFTELLMERDLDSETRTRYLETVSAEARRLTGLINDFLDLQRIEAGSFASTLGVVELDAVLQDQVELFSAQSSAHDLTLELPSAPLRVVSEPERVSQVMANLLSNAIKYSPKGGRIAVKAEIRGDAVRVAVTDEGLGIPAAQQAKLFTKFFRVDSSDTREIGGTGLGLALAREIVQAHHGRIGFESVEGEGSTFWLELPAARREATGGARILVVEDDPAAAALMTEYLGTNGFEIEVVASGEDALECALDDPPALISLDIGLAGALDGWGVLTALKANPETAGIPVIVCTAGNGHQEAATLGAAEFLIKPFSAARIRDVVAGLLPSAGSVLVADDDENIRRLVCDALAAERHEVSEAADGEEALALLRARRPDVVVLDLVMPKLDGFSVLEQIQDDPETRFLPVVVLTGKELSEEERTFLRFRTVSVLQKSSSSPAELRRLVGEALARASAQ